MKILLTGANGFVGSHVLDRLLAQNLSVVVLLRPNSDRRLITGQLARIEVRPGALDQPAALDAALEGVTHVIHCAGATKALTAEGFFAVNQLGTRNVVAAVNRRGGQIQRLVHISSLAAAGPALADKPRRESDPPQPVSDYGRSKLAAEREVTEGCRVDWTILRPPAVYGPRDAEFLRLFKAAKLHLAPRFGGGRQPLSLVYVEDLAAAIVAATRHANAARETFFVTSAEVVSTAELARVIAEVSGGWTLPLPLPGAVLWLACQSAEMLARLRKRPSVLSAQKWAELKAPGWVCDGTRFRGEVGYECRTLLRAGAAKTLDWYRTEGWL
ncbi:MAG: NAD-dependent epimerase/dehydratase family protein [Limisphaerales bacterium]